MLSKHKSNFSPVQICLTMSDIQVHLKTLEYHEKAYFFCDLIEKVKHLCILHSSPTKFKI